jgi:lambda family phage portal protein
MTRTIAKPDIEPRLRSFLQDAERGFAPAPKIRGKRSHSEKFFAGDDWQNSIGQGTNGGRGGFEGGKFDRATEDWNPGGIGPNRLQQDSRVMRERARDLVINNPYAAAAVDAYICNVIECGISPKAQFDDEERRALWDRQWRVWGGLTAFAPSQADITGHDSIYGLQALWLKEIIEAGGCLLHFVELPRDRANGRSLPLAIELIPEERFASNRDNFLAMGKGNPKTNNPIINGIEFDPATGRPTAYWILPHIPNDSAAGQVEPLRLPADQCVYGFFRRRVGQNRGYSLLHAVITWLWQLGYYTSNEMFASNQKSSWAYMLLTDSDDQNYEITEDGDESSATDAYGNRLDKLTPGMIWRGRPGDNIAPVGPNVPQSDSLPWIQLIERSIASGIHISESELTRDYSRSNFSNTRAAGNADRKRFRKMQQFCVTKFCNPVWYRFVQICTRIGIDGFPSQSQFMAAPEDWLEVRHRAPGWASVNPLDDRRADQISLAIGAQTLEDIVGEEGGDWEAKLEQQAKEMAKRQAFGLPLLIDSADATAEPVAATPDEPPAAAPTRTTRTAPAAPRAPVPPPQKKPVKAGGAR